jgi:hypothetical protein
MHYCDFRWGTHPDHKECGKPATIKWFQQWLCDEHYDVIQGIMQGNPPAWMIDPDEEEQHG